MIETVVFVGGEHDGFELDGAGEELPTCINIAGLIAGLSFDPVLETIEVAAPVCLPPMRYELLYDDTGHPSRDDEGRIRYGWVET